MHFDREIVVGVVVGGGIESVHIWVVSSFGNLEEVPNTGIGELILTYTYLPKASDFVLSREDDSFMPLYDKT